MDIYVHVSSLLKCLGFLYMLSAEKKGSLNLTFFVTLGILAKFPCKLILHSKLLSNFPPFCCQWVDLMHWVIIQFIAHNCSDLRLLKIYLWEISYLYQHVPLMTPRQQDIIKSDNCG